MVKSEKPPLLIVIERFYPLFGGAEVQCYQMAARLKKRGYEIGVVTKRLRSELSEEEAVAENFRIRRLGYPGPGRFLDYLSGFLLAWYLLRNRGKFKILFVDSGIANIFASTAILTGKLLAKVVVAKFETPGELTFSGKKALSPKKFVHPLIKFRLWLAKKADYYLAQTEEMGEELVLFGIERKKIRSFPNSVDEQTFSPAREDKIRKDLKIKLNLPIDKVLVFFCGRLVARKGLVNLIKSWIQITQKFKNAFLVLIGSGRNQPDSVEDELLAIVKSQNLENSTLFLGEKNRDEVAEYLKTADIFVYPSSHPEGRAVSVLEAMSSGIPVVVTDIGGLKEIVTEGKNGFLVEKNNVQAMFLALSKLIGDKSLRNKFGANARIEILKKYSLNKSVEDVDKFLVSIS